MPFFLDFAATSSVLLPRPYCSCRERTTLGNSGMVFFNTADAAFLEPSIGLHYWPCPYGLLLRGRRRQSYSPKQGREAAAHVAAAVMLSWLSSSCVGRTLTVVVQAAGVKGGSLARCANAVSNSRLWWRYY